MTVAKGASRVTFNVRIGEFERIAARGGAASEPELADTGSSSAKIVAGVVLIAALALLLIPAGAIRRRE